MIVVVIICVALALAAMALFGFLVGREVGRVDRNAELFERYMRDRP